MIGCRTGIFSGKGAAFDFENCLQFDGVNDYISFTTIATVTKMSFWIYPTRFGDAIFGDISGSSTALRIISATNVRISFGFEVVFPSSTIVLNQWNHIYLYRSGGIIKGVANGVISTTNTSTSFQNYNQIGSYYTGALYFSGKLDELGASSGTGSDSEALELYNSGSGAAISDYFDPANTLIYYQFNETSGTTAADSSPSGNNATLNNFTGTYWVAH